LLFCKFTVIVFNLILLYKKTETMLKYVNILFLAGMILMNYLANAIPINNRTTGELSDSFPNLFVPAGITFSIWGIIYLLLIIFAVVQFLPANQSIVTRIGWLFVFSCTFNALWIVAWHYGKLPASLLIMTGLLVTLIYINLNIRGDSFGIIKAAFGVYLGWICIATIANVTALLVHYNWAGFGLSGEAWTIIMIAAGAIIAVLAIMRLVNPYIGLAVIWAFAGIIIKRQDDHRSIVIAAGTAILIVTIVTILGFLRRNTDLS
jgi:hypothetical protein